MLVCYKVHKTTSMVKILKMFFMNFISGTNAHVVEKIDVYIFVQGLNPRTRSDSIQSYFESIGKPASVKDKILFNLDHTEALVIFQHKPGKNVII